ncbi:hypothetical protein LCGC14_2399750 [marine sediment metagenome]|uniref:Uncharacterized protein n=1 Tax=marine sediment metagenome TaxID=412755 RepID=A0A0F9E812_9ZZZZ
MDTHGLRLECLRLASLAAATAPPEETEAVLKRARAYANFIMGTAEPPKPMQAEPATPESETDPRNPNVPGHEKTGHIAPPTT